MKINSELPLCMLSFNNELNEYDFVLFHLYKTNKRYRNYYLAQRRLYPDRLMIFDNSAYEFYVKGEQLDLEEYFNAIMELKPDMYILPDVLMDSQKTIDGVTEFFKKYNTKIETATGCEPLAVIQGNSEEELIKCMDIYRDLDISNIAIPFHNSFFVDEMYPSCTEDQIDIIKQHYKEITLDHKYALGRMEFVTRHVWDLMEFAHVHLLGSHCPFEKKFYGGFIDTMDTGYPVKCAMEGVMMGHEKSKPNIIIDEFLDKELSPKMKDLIKLNVSIFREL